MGVLNPYDALDASDEFTFVVAPGAAAIASLPAGGALGLLAGLRLRERAQAPCVAAACCLCLEVAVFVLAAAACFSPFFYLYDNPGMLRTWGVYTVVNMVAAIPLWRACVAKVRSG